MKPLKLEDYYVDINLFEPFIHQNGRLNENEKAEIVKNLLLQLKEVIDRLDLTITGSYVDNRQNLHAVLDILNPGYLKDEQVSQLNALLQAELLEKSVIEGLSIARNTRLKIQNIPVAVWQGDITTLHVDVIVNAANNRLLGCFQPLHHCIDNAIHAASGVQLRNDCFVIMQKQKMPEPTGEVKITRAYNLPSNFVMHTVGPIVNGAVNQEHEEDLANCYIRCLNLCRSIEQIRSIAFCCISTGVFGYPQEKAARLAFNTVCNWLDKNPDALDYLIFNVFTDKDKILYENLIETSWKQK